MRATEKPLIGGISVVDAPLYACLDIYMAPRHGSRGETLGVPEEMGIVSKDSRLRRRMQPPASRN